MNDGLGGSMGRARVLSMVPIAASVAIAAGMLGAGPATAATKPPAVHALSADRVAQLAGPAVVLVETKVTARVKTPTAKFSQDKTDDVVRSDPTALNAARNGDRNAFLHRLAELYHDDPVRFMVIGAGKGTDETLDAIGTGFLVGGNGEVLTNAHVVFGDDAATHQILVEKVTGELGDLQEPEDSGGTIPDADEILFEQGDQKLLEHLVATSTFENVTKTVTARRTGKDGTPELAATVVKLGAEYPGEDLAVLQVDGLKGHPSLSFAAAAPATGGDVVVLGFPGAATFGSGTDTKESLVPSLTKGVVSALKTSEQGVPVVQLDASIAPGNSGGPILDATGKVVGVSVAATNSPGNFNFGIGGLDAAAFVAAAGATPSAAVTGQLALVVADLDGARFKAAKADFVALDASAAGEPYLKVLHDELDRRVAAKEKDLTPSEGLKAAVLAAGTIALLLLVGSSALALLQWRAARKNRTREPKVDPFVMIEPPAGWLGAPAPAMPAPLEAVAPIEPALAEAH